MKANRWIAKLAPLVLAGWLGEVPMAECAVVDFSPDGDNEHYSTVYSNQVLLEWSYPADATGATLTITGTNYSRSFTGDTSYTWDTSQLPANTVYQLALAFSNGETQKVSLAVVSGVGSRHAAVILDSAQSTVWRHVPDPLLLPYNAAWQGTNAAGTLTVTDSLGLSRTNRLDGSGYLAYSPKGFAHGLLSLSLSFDDATNNLWNAVLDYPAGGTRYTLR